jgi:hypothetical protein
MSLAMVKTELTALPGSKLVVRTRRCARSTASAPRRSSAFL